MFEALGNPSFERQNNSVLYGFTVFPRIAARQVNMLASLSGPMQQTMVMQMVQQERVRWRSVGAEVEVVTKVKFSMNKLYLVAKAYQSTDLSGCGSN